MKNELDVADNDVKMKDTQENKNIIGNLMKNKMGATVATRED
jgi:hypothetical protein